MIRIDEIYYNTFVKYLQERPQTSVHWFDPFGSVKFSDVTNSHAINNRNRDARRYLFWDQEPIQRDLFRKFAEEFTTVYDGATTLITSEYASEEVRWACDTYNFRPAYYFFHGWAALDWFRGYNRSFLMQPYNERRITRTFTAPNRIVAGERQHRLIMLYHMIKMNMLNNHISCPATCPAENITIEQAIKPLAAAYPDIQEVFANTCFPKSFVGEANAPMHSYRLDLFQECSQSLLYVVTETVATGRRQHLTEKTFKPIALCMPFVIVSTAHSLRYLRSYGFRTFDHLWDETYDTIEDDDLRYSAIARVLRDLDELPLRCRQRLHRQAQEVCEHNYEHFYSGTFERVLWSELTGMLQGL